MNFIDKLIFHVPGCSEEYS